MIGCGLQNSYSTVCYDRVRRTNDLLIMAGRSSFLRKVLFGRDPTYNETNEDWNRGGDFMLGGIASLSLFAAVCLAALFCAAAASKSIRRTQQQTKRKS